MNKTAIENQNNRLGISRKTSTDYLFEYGGRITSNTKLLVEAKVILQKIRKKGGNPIALAAGALYYVYKKKNLKITKEKIAQAFGISHRTVYSNEAQIRAKLQQMSEQNAYFSLAPKELLVPGE